MLTLNKKHVWWSSHQQEQKEFLLGIAPHVEAKLELFVSSVSSVCDNH